MKHLADFLGAEMRRRHEEFDRTKIMQCWDCINVIWKLARAYKLHWDRKKQKFKEESDYK